jgi:hypothetical protein
MQASNQQRQHVSEELEEELEVLSSIFDTQIEVQRPPNGPVVVIYTDKEDGFIITFTLPAAYPLTRPECDVTGINSLSKEKTRRIRDQVQKCMLALHEAGAVVMFETIEKLKELLCSDGDAEVEDVEEEGVKEGEEVCGEDECKGGLSSFSPSTAERDEPSQVQVEVIHGPTIEEKQSE